MAKCNVLSIFFFNVLRKWNVTKTSSCVHFNITGKYISLYNNATFMSEGERERETDRDLGWGGVENN